MDQNLEEWTSSRRKWPVLWNGSDFEWNQKDLTRLTWLIHTSVLPSIWNPDKIFAPTGLLGQVHIVKKIFLKFLHAGAIFFLFILLSSFEEIHKFSNKNDQHPAWRNFENIFFTICTRPNRPVGAKFLSGFHIEGKTDVWISQVRRVKNQLSKYIHWQNLKKGLWAC